VAGLVYIAAFRSPIRAIVVDSARSLDLAPMGASPADSQGFLKLTEAGVMTSTCPDLTLPESASCFCAQRQTAAAVFGNVFGGVREKQTSWYLVATATSPSTEPGRSMPYAINATTVEESRKPSSRCLARLEEKTNLILERRAVSSRSNVGLSRLTALPL